MNDAQTPPHFPVPISNFIDVLKLAPGAYSMAETLLYKIHITESVDGLDWIHGRAEGFSLGLQVAGALTLWQRDYLSACYTAARAKREQDLLFSP